MKIAIVYQTSIYANVSETKLRSLGGESVEHLWPFLSSYLHLLKKLSKLYLFMYVHDPNI